jgi:2-hydroxychromene-2-carboxylate isomerase
MAEVIQLTKGRRGRSSSASADPAAVTFYFDLASPHTYLAAERVERRFGGASWRPAMLWTGAPVDDEEVAHATEMAAHRARELRMPLVWPERYPASVPAAMRVATYAAQQGCGSTFAIAAGRLAFCGGFDIEDPDMLAEAAAAAGLEVREALAAARAPDRDEEIVAAGRSVWIEGGTVLPALCHEGRLYCGEPQISGVLSRIGGFAERPRVS